MFCIVGERFSHFVQSLVSPSFILTCTLPKETSSSSSGSILLASTSDPISGNHHEGGSGTKSPSLVNLVSDVSDFH